EILQTLKKRMFADKKIGEFMVQVEELGAKHPESLPILEFWAALYNELNRESQYFEILIKLFDANFNSGSFQKASEILERLVDIDSYDYRNQQRLEQLSGHVEEAFLRRVAGRMAKTATMAPPPTSHPRAAASQEVAENRGDVPGRRRTQRTVAQLVSTGELVAETARKARGFRKNSRRAGCGSAAYPANRAHGNVHCRDFT